MTYTYDLTPKTVKHTETFIKQLQSVNDSIFGIEQGVGILRIMSLSVILDLSLLDSVIPNSQSLVEIIGERVASDIEFGEGLKIAFAAENVLLGITQDGMTNIVLERMGGVLNALQTGSLKDAISKARLIPVDHYDSKYITPSRLLMFTNKIESRLNVPLSSSL